MKFIIGFITVIGMVMGGYVLHHGKMSVLYQPTEFMIIGGAAVGSFVIGTPGHLIKDVLKSFKLLLKGAIFKKADYIELLTMLFATFKLMKSKGMLEMESHIENPHSSGLFGAYPKFAHNHHAVTFFCDYLRIMTLGIEDYYTLEELMDREIQVHRNHGKHVEHTVVTMADGMPALGIVAAVLGVIVTMGSITEPPEILGKLIGAALVGTFLGVLMSYGFIAPMGRYMGEQMEAGVKYMECIKVGLLSHLKGNAPTVSVEFARTSLDGSIKPGFLEVEEACSRVSVPSGG
jgi:chemotaxis protein MotA